MPGAGLRLFQRAHTLDTALERALITHQRINRELAEFARSI